MKCPFCSKEMEQGVLQAGDIILWARKRHKISLLPKDGEVMLDRNVLGYTAIPSWICKDCRKVITEYEDKDNFL